MPMYLDIIRWGENAVFAKSKKQQLFSIFAIKSVDSDILRFDLIS